MQIYKPIVYVQLGAYLNADVINHLIHLFDEHNHDPVVREQIVKGYLNYKSRSICDSSAGLPCN